MPDVWLLTTSFVTAMLSAGVFCLLAYRRGTAPDGSGTAAVQLRPLFSLSCGVMAGMAVQGILPAFPLVSALDRWLAIGLPMLMLADVAGCFLHQQLAVRWIKVVAAVAVAPVILYGSVHLQVMPDASAQSGSSSFGLLPLAAAGGVLLLLTLLADSSAAKPDLQRTAAGIYSGLILLTVQVTAVVVMLGGWIGCGAAALPVTGAGTGLLLAGLLLRQHAAVTVVIRWASRSLGGIIVLGHYFGRLTVAQAALILAAAVIPLLVLRSGRGLQSRGLWVSAVLTLLFLSLVLLPAILEFQRRMAVLLS